MKFPSITRRDFLAGSAVSITGAGLLSPSALFGKNSEDYPPTLQGMRGSHAGSFEMAHASRFVAQPGSGVDTEEGPFDLVVIGGGISGLAGAYFFQKKKKDARILILDNHDDFGGHAKRNEFHYDGKMYLMNGGTYLIESPSQYKEAARQLLHDIGIDFDRYFKIQETVKGYVGQYKLVRNFFFEKGIFGKDLLTREFSQKPDDAFFENAAFSAQGQADLERLHEADFAKDFFPELSPEKRKVDASLKTNRS